MFNTDEESSESTTNSLVLVGDLKSQNSSSPATSLGIVDRLDEISNKTNSTAVTDGRIQYTKEEFLELKQSETSKIRHTLLSAEFNNVNGLYSPEKMIRILWARAGIVDNVKKAKPKPAVNRVQLPKLSLPHAWPPMLYCKPLSPGQLAVLDSILYRKLGNQNVPIKMSVDEFMSNYEPKNDFSYDHRQLEASYPHLQPGFTQSTFRASDFQPGFSDDNRSSRIVPIFRPAQRTFGFVPMARPATNQANCRHFNSMNPSLSAQPLMSPNMAFEHGNFQRMPRPPHRFSANPSQNRYSLSSYDSFGFPWTSRRHSEMDAPRFNSPLMLRPRFMDSSQLRGNDGSPPDLSAGSPPDLVENLHG